VAEDPSPSLLAELSHELRTPLAAILGFADAMRAQAFGALGDRYLEHAGLIHQAGRHMLSLVEDLAMAETGRGLCLQRIDLMAITAEIVAIMRGSAAAAGLSLSFSVGEPLVIDADPKLIRQLLLNLIANAVKFTPAGGTVTLTAFAETGHVVLTVADTGVGMSADGDMGPGQGLGLHLARGFCRRLGGELVIDSAPGQGTRVSARLPAA
jgi:signal transduction histidine kinase